MQSTKIQGVTAVASTQNRLAMMFMGRIEILEEQGSPKILFLLWLGVCACVGSLRWGLDGADCLSRRHNSHRREGVADRPHTCHKLPTFVSLLVVCHQPHLLNFKPSVQKYQRCGRACKGQGQGHRGYKIPERLPCGPLSAFASLTRGTNQNNSFALPFPQQQNEEHIQ